MTDRIRPRWNFWSLFGLGVLIVTVAIPALIAILMVIDGRHGQ